MLLKNKNAVIYGAGGGMGSAIAQAFAREGASVFLVGRTLAPLEAVANEIGVTGGTAEVAQVDALDAQAVDAHLAEVVRKTGHIDISFNLMGMGDSHGTPLVKMTPEHFMVPIANAMTGHFNTATAAGRQMAAQKSGVILALTANAARRPYADVGGFGVACAAIEGLCRQLALELGPNNIRVICLRSAGSPNAPGVDAAFRLHAQLEGVSREAFEVNMAKTTLLKHLPQVAEVANAAVLMASDHASAITAAVTNVTCGELVD